MSDIITVHIEEHEQYPVYSGYGVLNELPSFLKKYPDSKAVLFIDENVADLHGPRIESKISDEFESTLEIIVPQGEKSKSLDFYTEQLAKVLEYSVERSTPLIVIGGGVTGDVGAFIASTILRGMPLIHVPTTLLAMTDSSIGGKTGINYKTGKNLIGSFYQPHAVFADSVFLETLGEREIINGMSEVLKYGYIRDSEIFSQLHAIVESDQITVGKYWDELIRKSIFIKKDIVEKDQKEKGIRAFLNFGHTFAHAIEKWGEYGEYSHGESVFMGMYAAIHASNSFKAEISYDALDRVKDRYDLSGELSESDIPELMDNMMSDKKKKNDHLHLILLHDTGRPYIKRMEDSDEDIITDSWRFMIRTLLQ